MPQGGPFKEVLSTDLFPQDLIPSLPTPFSDSASATALTNQTTPGTSIPKGYHKYQTQHVLRDFFKDRDTFNFKYGLEVGLNSNLDGKSTDHSLLNLDEDPTIFGFDLVILNNSPLFNNIGEFINFGANNGIKDISNREETYDNFVTQFSKFFNVDDRTNNLSSKNKDIFKSNNGFNSFKTHYLHGIKGLDKLLHHTGMGYEGGKQMVDFGKDKLTVSLTEDIGINAGYLAALYRTLSYSKVNGRMVIPENLLRFDMSIIISEVRNMNRVSNALAKSNITSYELTPTLNDNVSRYIFTLYECQLDFNNYSFMNEMSMGGHGESAPGVSSGLTFDIFYKYIGMEMEKFDFRPDLPDEAKYINDSKVNPNSFQVNTDPYSDINQQKNALNADKFPNRPMDRKFQMNTSGNSDVEDREYEYDFPMMNRKYVKSNIDARNKNIEIRGNQSSLRSGLNNIIGSINQELQTKFIELRSQLLSGLVAKIRTTTGMRNIASPVNVYESTNLGQFALNKLRDFGNLALGEALSYGSGFLNNLSQGVENSVFDIANRGVNALKGEENIPNSTRDILGNQGIPNVYKNK
tara:strand:+ start:20963 stop:22696 length:1734 start_codon:yes stop_codon:yes gene_type:complete